MMGFFQFCFGLCQQPVVSLLRLFRFDLFELGHPSTAQELRGAFQVVYQEYLRQGYCREESAGTRFSLFDFLPVCFKFICSDRKKQVIGTASLVLDSDAKLPADNVFSEELDLLRSSGAKIGEGTMFAVLEDVRQSSPFITLRLIGAVFGSALRARISDLVVVVNPKHVGFYTRCLGFKAISTVKGCKHVKEAPGVLLCRNLNELRKLNFNVLIKYWKIFVLAAFSPVSLVAVDYDRENIQTFLRENPSVWNQASPELKLAFNQLFLLGNLEKLTQTTRLQKVNTFFRQIGGKAASYLLVNSSGGLRGSIATRWQLNLNSSE